MNEPFSCPGCGRNIDCVCAEQERAWKIMEAAQTVQAALQGLYQEEMLAALEAGLLKAQATERGDTEPEARTKQRIARMRALLVWLPRVPQGVEVEPVEKEE